ncbi:MAG: 3-dehydroquinate synthase [Clostridia bacterium]|nr:3-dehydroquinate synthase [Clostridia bacterium]
MIRIKVQASTGYEVVIDRGLLDRAGQEIAAVQPPCRVAVVSDDTVFPLCGRRVTDSLSRAGFAPCSFVFPAGEQSKNLETYTQLLRFLAAERFGRGDLLVALGGGVVGDLTGFAAATWLRGVRYVQLPTTLLAAVDASVGGKTAVDLPEGKNLVGAFCQPARVLCDPDVLRTLPEAVFRDGCAEIIKMALLGSAPFFAWLDREGVRQSLEYAIETAVTMKRDIVAEDEFDRGRRQLLNLGHTIGHAVERCSGFTVSHGSAVAIGMAVITAAAERRGLCLPGTGAALEQLLRRCGLPTESPYDAARLMEAVRHDKKITASGIALVVPEAIGRCRSITVPTAELPDWLRDGGVV